MLKWIAQFDRTYGADMPWARLAKNSICLPEVSENGAAAQPLRLFVRVIVLTLIGMMIVLTAPLAVAQDGAKSDNSQPPPLSSNAIDAINALASLLSDTEVRSLLLHEIESRNSVEPNQQVISVDLIIDGFATAAGHVVEAILNAPDSARAMATAMRSYFETLGTRATTSLVGCLLVAMLVGHAIEHLYRRFVPASAFERNKLPFACYPFPTSIPHLARNLFQEIGGTLLALAAAALIMTLVLPEKEARIGMTAFVWIYFFPRLVAITMGFFLSPQRPELRLVTTDDRTARLLTNNAVGLMIVIGSMETVLRVAKEIGASGPALQMGFWVNALVFFWLAMIVVMCRAGLQSILRGRDLEITGWEHWLVFAYPVLAIGTIFAIWVAGALAGLFGKDEIVREGRHLFSVVLILLTPMFDTGIRATVRLLVPPMRGTGTDAVDAYEAASRGYVRIGRVIVFGGIITILASLWDISLFRSSDADGGLFSGVYLEGTLILVCGFVALELTSIFFNRRLANEVAFGKVDLSTENEEHLAPVGTSSRLGTILPPLSWALQAAIIVVTVLTALGHMGLNVTALLAGAGVIGVALGFGAQKLVADVVSGLFFLIEDAFRLNEYVDAGGMEGTVEQISLRSLQLRKSDGALHCVPYSGVKAITNFSRDWGTMKQVFTVPFNTNIEKVRKIFKRIGEELAEVPEYRDAFIQPFKYKGVSQVNDVGIVVRGKFMFKPEKAMQFLIQREIYKRIQTEFEIAGIEFARREVHVSVERRGKVTEGVSEDDVDETAAGAASDAMVAALATSIKKQ